MLPALDFLDVLEKEGYTELLSLVQAAGLTKNLETIDNVTIFAPTNAAIQVRIWLVIRLCEKPLSCISSRVKANYRAKQS